MGCLKKLSYDIPAECHGIGILGMLRNVSELLLINRSDIASYSVESGVGGESDIVLAQGTRGYLIEATKSSIQVLISYRQLENAPVMQEHTIIIKPIAGAYLTRVALSGIANGDFVALARENYTTGGASVLGLLSGLTCSDFTIDSANGAMLTTTLKTPEGCAGDRDLFIGAPAYEALKKQKA